MESKICRVCLDKTATISVFDQQDNIQYAIKIMRCVNVSIAENDGLPDSICETCAGDLSVAFEFTQKCEASDKALRCLDYLQTKSELDIKGEAIKDEVKEELDITEPEQYDNYLVKTPEKTITKHKKKKAKNFLGKKSRSKLGPVQCTSCGHISVCQSALDRHIRTHTKEKPFTCDLCGTCYGTKGTLKRHIVDNHKPSKDDNEECRTINIFDRRRNRPKMGPIQCVVCGLMTMSRSALESHMRTHTGEKPFGCTICDVRYMTKGSLKRHVEIYHMERQRKYTCEHCGNSFYRKNEIITHLRIHTDERPYTCPFCSSGFRQITSLIRHKRVHTGERPYPCSICSKAFSDKSLLNKHQSVHSDAKNYTCHLCSKSVKSKCALKTHLMLHSNEKHNVCTYCKMTFSLKGNLKTHIRRMHSEKSGQCEVCHKTFPNLEVHLRKHTGERPYMCKLCDQGYATQRSLSHHLAFRHANSAKYKCSVGDCTKTFPMAMMLEFHVLKQHTNSTPYFCHHCSRGFFRTSDLSRHLKCSHMDTHTQVVKAKRKAQDS